MGKHRGTFNIFRHRFRFTIYNFKKMWLLLAIVFQSCNLMQANHPDCGKQQRERVGSSGAGHSTGAESSTLTHPWAIAILFSDKLHCSGSILSESYVLTAAHCFQDEGIPLDETK